MCKIITIRYVSPDGRRRSTERKQLCFRSDGNRPCLHAEYEEVTELVSSGTPSLIYDDIPSPVSTSIPGTPLTATAHYEVRAPAAGEASKSRGKGKSFVPFLDLGRNKKKSSGASSPTTRHRSNYSHSGSSNGDADSIIAIEEDGVIGPVTPTRGDGYLSMRRARQPPLISQPQLSLPSGGLRAPAPGPFHRRTFTAPETVRFDVDTEVTDRANAREQLRRENRERQRLDDSVRSGDRLRQEADDRKVAEDLARQERKDRAEDDFSRLEYDRLQEKDRLRRERQESKKDAELEGKSKETQVEIEEIEKEIREMKEQADRRKRLEAEAERRADAERQEKRVKDEERKIERRLQDQLERIRDQRSNANARQVREVQDQMDKLELELAKQQERRQARERAEHLQQEIRQHDLLAEEIREMEMERELEMGAARAVSGVRRLESVYAQPREHGYDNQRYITAPPRSPNVIQRLSPFQDENYRRAVGASVLEQERNLASARTLGGRLQNTIEGPGLGRRNTVGGRDQDREKHYRNLRRWYPE